MKFVSLVLIFLTFALGGHRLVMRQKRLIEREEAIKMLLRHMHRNAAFFRMPIFEIYSSFSSPVLEDCGFMKTLCESGLFNAFAVHKNDFDYDDFVWSNLMDFARNPGMMPCDELVLSIEKTEALLEEALDKKRKEFPIKQKLYNTLGITTGVFMVILFL